MIFDVLASFFTKAEEANKEKLNEILATVTDVIDKFPPKILKAISGKVFPTVNKSSYRIDFSLTDVLWWKEAFKNEVIVFKDPKVVKAEIKTLLLNEMSNYTDPDTSTKEMNEYLKTLITESDLND